LSGARTIVMDTNAARLQFVQGKMGITDTILLAPAGEAQAAERLSAITNGQLADVVVDATGSNKSMAAALGYCAYAARLVYVGITQQEISFFQAPVLHRREVTILASRNALPPDFTRIISLIEDGKINTGPWITHHAKFDDMIGVFPTWLKPESGVIKAVVEVV